LPVGARVLDLCCGVGRHSLELARRGFKVTGVDRTAAYLKQARQQVRREGLKVELVQQDMREFVRPAAFDLTVNLFTSFGYFQNPKDDLKVVTNVFRSLAPGGSFVIDVHGKETLARIFTERGWYESEGYTVLEDRRIHPGWAAIDSRWIIFKGGKRKECSFTLRLFSAAEMIALLRSGGFRSGDVYGDFAGSPYDHNAKRLVAVARK
jgi:SAM-dependent methyltransferase